MARTRSGLLSGAARALAAKGVRQTTMTDVAAAAGVAKATLYNHFRTKHDVWAALIVAEVERLAAECAGRSLENALVHAAVRLSTDPAVRRVAADDPQSLAGLVTGSDSVGWHAARMAVRAALETAGRGGDDTVLRWLSTHLSTPGSEESARAGAAALIAGLPRDAPPVRDLPGPAECS